jgi:hypothetical protein
MRRANRLQDLNETVGLVALNPCDLRGTPETRLSITQLTRDGNREINREVYQELVAALIESLEQRQVTREVRRSGVGMLQRFQMILIPGVIPDNPNLVDGDVFDLRAAAVDGNRQPLLALWRFDLIAVPPAPFIVLHIIVKDK